MLNIFLANAKCNHRNSTPPLFFVISPQAHMRKKFLLAWDRDTHSHHHFTEFFTSVLFHQSPLLLIQAMC